MAYEPKDVHVAKALEYARAVVSGSVPACKYVRQACQRQLDDLARTDAGFVALYVWDEDKAGRICRYIERLPHVKGPKAKVTRENDGLIHLEGWQCFILTTVFGWRRRDTGGRRFRHSYTEVPRGNAKSTLSSGVGLYCMTSDDEEGAEVYSAATKKEQAKIVQGDATKMMRKRPDFAAKLGVVVNQLSLLHPKSNSKFEPLSKDHGTLDGLNVHCAIIDELHAHKDRGIYDVIETGAAKRDASLIWVITTSGSDTAGICYEQRTYVTKILERSVEDESYFGIIYTIDDGDDWTDPKVWQKANPNWGVSVRPDAFEALALKAMRILSAQNNFKTKHLDLWVNADIQWMEMGAWDRCGDPTLDESTFREEECFVGMDLASKTDIVCRAKVYRRMEPKRKKCSTCGQPLGEAAGAECKKADDHNAGEPHYYGFLDSYLPESAVTDGRNSQYEGWELEGRLKTTPGDVIDFTILKEDMISDRDNHSIRECGFDPWQSVQLAQELQAEAIPMVEVRATVLNFSAPMKEWDALVRNGQWHHDCNPVFRWMVSNVVCHYDVKENVYPRKQTPGNKIDGAVATIMALNRALLNDPGPYGSGRGFLTL